MSVEIRRIRPSSNRSVWEWSILIEGKFVAFIRKRTHKTKVEGLYIKDYTVFALTNADRDDAVVLFESCTHDYRLNKTGGGLGAAKKWVRDNLSTKEDFIIKTTCAQLKEIEELF